jgi:hypothetical protein
MLPESRPPISAGTHARHPDASRQAIKKLWAGNKGTVKSGRKEVIARIENVDRISELPPTDGATSQAKEGGEKRI